MKRVIFAFQLEEKLPELYHVTKLTKFKSILDSNEYIPGSWNNLSMTSDKDLFKNPQNVRLKIDVDKLISSGFEIIHYTEEYAKSIGNNDAVNSENEYRVICPDGIPKFCNYIDNVAICKSDKLFDSVIENYSIDLNDFLKECEKSNVSVYDWITGEAVKPEDSDEKSEQKKNEDLLIEELTTFVKELIEDARLNVDLTFKVEESEDEYGHRVVFFVFNTGDELEVNLYNSDVRGENANLYGVEELKSYVKSELEEIIENI